MTQCNLCGALACVNSPVPLDLKAAMSMDQPGRVQLITSFHLPIEAVNE